MSEKFGLDWKEYDQVRMETFWTILKLQAEREKQENDKMKSKYGR